LHRAGFPVQVLTKRVEDDQPKNAEIDGVPVRRVGPSGPRSAAGKWLALPSFFFALLAHDPPADVIVCIDYRGIGIAAVIAGRLLRRPVVAQGETAAALAGPDGTAASGLTPEPAAVRLLKAPARAVYRRADHVVCIGRDLEREALRAGVARERVHYIP